MSQTERAKFRIVKGLYPNDVRSFCLTTEKGKVLMQVVFGVSRTRISNTSEYE